MAGPLRPNRPPSPPELNGSQNFFPVPKVPKKVIFSLMARPLREELFFRLPLANQSFLVWLFPVSDAEHKIAERTAHVLTPTLQYIHPFVINQYYTYFSNTGLIRETQVLSIKIELFFYGLLES